MLLGLFALLLLSSFLLLVYRQPHVCRWGFLQILFLFTCPFCGGWGLSSHCGLLLFFWDWGFANNLGLDLFGAFLLRELCLVYCDQEANYAQYEQNVDNHSINWFFWYWLLFLLELYLFYYEQNLNQIIVNWKCTQYQLEARNASSITYAVSGL